MKSLDVYFFDKKAGLLNCDKHNRWQFHYLKEWLEYEQARPISISLPLQEIPFNDEKPRAFFTNLLPEAEIKQILARQLGISEKNDFQFLESFGGECAGAIVLLPQGMQYLINEHNYQILSQGEFHDLVKGLATHPLLVGKKNVRLSLAGAQNKLPVYIHDKKIAIPLGNSPSTHIIKLPLKHYPYSVENEAFCMFLANSMSMLVPEVHVSSTPTYYYNIVRYDREIGKDGHVTRLHQEDFCQALGILPEYKYEAEGGPSLKQCFGFIKQYSIDPSVDSIRLLQWVIFNYLIGNADGHAKNIAFLWENKGPKLAPFYDMLSTVVYPDLHKKMAMKIGGENRPGFIHLRHWQRFAEDIQINFVVVKYHLEDMQAKILVNAEKLQQLMKDTTLDIQITFKIIEVIEKRSKHLSRILS